MEREGMPRGRQDEGERKIRRIEDDADNDTSADEDEKEGGE